MQGAQPDTKQILVAPAGNSFRPEQRIRKPAEYQAVFSAPRFRCGSDYWQLIVRTNSLRALGGCRLGLAVSKKVSKRAVVRNQIKRLLRESFRTLKWRYELGLDIVVIARPALLSLSSAQQRQALERMLDKVYYRFTKHRVADMQTAPKADTDADADADANAATASAQALATTKAADKASVN